MKTDFTQYFLSIPVNNTQSGVCLVARHASELICIHTFRKLYASLPLSEELAELTPVDVMFTCRTWDYKAIGGDWSVIGHCSMDDDKFSHLWGVPAFARVELLGLSQCSRVEYESDLVTGVESPCSFREALRLDQDMIRGVDSVALEIRSMLIENEYDDLFLTLKQKRDNGLAHLARIHE